MARRFPLKIQTAPKTGNIYWCDFGAEGEVHLPEFWKKRPALIVSRKNYLRGKVIVLPITTSEENAGNKYAYFLDLQASPLGRSVWIVCDHPMTVATSRLEYISSKPLRLRGAALTSVLALCHQSIAGSYGNEDI